MKRLVLTAALVSLPLSGWADTRRFALIAGANDGGADRVTLQYAITDAQAFGSVLEDLGGVPASNQTLLVEPNAQVMRDAITNLGVTIATAEDRGLRTEVVVYYSGHSDETGLLLGEQRYPYDELRADLKGIGADVQVVVLDSCASGAMVRTKGGVHRPAFLEDQSNDVEGVAYLMSASADESAQESDVVGASYFTHFLVSGLRGGADQTGDGRVTLDEAYAFASSETLRRTERTSVGAQHAIFDMNMKGHGGFVFTDLSQTTSSLVFDEAVAGRLFVRNGDNQLVAEMNKAAERAVEIALDEGTYTVVLEQGDDRLEAVFEIGAAEHLLVTDLQFQPMVTEAVVARGSAVERKPMPVADLDQEPVARVPVDRNWGEGPIIGFLPRSDDTAAQLGLLGARATKNRGFQLGSVFATAGRMDGLQMSLFVLHADVLNGSQLSSGLNVTNAASTGAQVGLINVANDTLVGAQIGLVNSSQDMSGVQIGLVNESPSSRSFQLGVVNHGGKGSGLQVGLVNIANDYDGGAIGLVTLHRQGYNHLFFNVGTANSLMVTGAWGSRWLYTSVQFGMQGSLKAPSIAGGAGLHVPVREKIYVDTDAVVGFRFSTDDAKQGVVSRLRIQPGWVVKGRTAVQTGLELEVTNASIRAADNLVVGWTFGLRI